MVDHLSLAQTLLSRFAIWADERADVRAAALVGSHARGDARPDSDVDLVILAREPAVLLLAPDWCEFFGPVVRLSTEDYGRLLVLRAWYGSGMEVEFGLASPRWATSPDKGTRRVVREGCRVLLYKDSLFAGLL
ncbi:MAG: nucleotidyltransferase domain-containing protein [Fimbriimonadaceae bacterium]|nr:MAG: nucleotidyltransferase domain-containing protein [Fimbriimonadaceae bacterium]